MLGNANNRANRKKEEAKYTLMSSKEKVIYLANKLKEELDLLDIDLTCSAGRDTCIDCSIQEIINEAGKL